MNKKMPLIISILLLCCYSIFGNENTEKSKLEKMRELEKGTTYNEIVSQFGKPDEILGSGLLIIGYVFEDSEIMMNFFTGWKLQAMREIKKNGEKIELIPLTN